MKKINLFSVFALLAIAVIGVVFSSCKKDDPVDPNAGKTDPSTIATANLVAYFPFEGNGTDEISKMAPTQQNAVTYVTGRRGKAYQGAETNNGNSGAYLLYSLNASSKLATMTDGFTISTWLKSPKVYETKDAQGTSTYAAVPAIVQIGNSTGDLYWGNLTFMQERLSQTADSVLYKSCFQTAPGTQWVAEGRAAKFSADKWQYITFSYDAATKAVDVYVNAVKYEERSKVFTFTESGNLTFKNVDNLVIGGWNEKIAHSGTSIYQGFYKGNIDELRIYNKGLTAAEVKALYDAEVTQIN